MFAQPPQLSPSHIVPTTAVEGGATYVNGLNERQREAVMHTEGPLLVLAGAGTGKTKVLTTRVVHILATQRVFPSQMMAVTFTNKAAREMQHRISSQVEQGVDGMWLGTFHSLAVRMLRRNAEAAQLRPEFTILDQDDQQRLVKQELQAHNIDDKQWPARVVLSFIQRFKDKGWAPDRVPTFDYGDLVQGQLRAIYRAYQERLRTLNAVDFGDILLHCLTMWHNAPDILQRYQQQLKYILVDEYQDTNQAQYQWLRQLTAHNESPNLCCVGDDDQSIYSWRGAEVGNILQFERDFKNAKVIRLEQNYRSTQPILDAAGHLINNNRSRLGKTLWTEQPGGEPLKVVSVDDGYDEARYIGGEIEALRHKKHAYQSMAILVRAGFQTRAFEERLLQLAIPYRVVGGPRFYERQEIRDAIAYLRLIWQLDDNLAFERIINLPRRGIGDTSIQQLYVLARAKKCSLFAAAQALIETDEMRANIRTSLRKFIEQILSWRTNIQSTTPSELVAMVLDESGYTAMWQSDHSPEAPGRLDNLKELVVALKSFTTIGGFLEHVSLVLDDERQNDHDMVNIMTLHSAKGLEFDTVFLPGWEEGLFPNQRSLDEEGAKGLEEERRLAYVGLTRAKQRVFIVHASQRQMYGQWQFAVPSRFIGELPEASIEQLQETSAPRAKQSFYDTQHHWRDVTPKAESRPARLEVVSKTGFRQGQRVRHAKYGFGVIKMIEGDKLDIIFEQGGLKKILATFVESA